MARQNQRHPDAAAQPEPEAAPEPEHPAEVIRAMIGLASIVGMLAYERVLAMIDKIKKAEAA